MARMGLDLWAIQLIGRWGSDKVKLYVRAAQADSAAVWATQAAKQTDLESLLSTLQARLKLPSTSALPMTDKAKASLVAAEAKKATEELIESQALDSKAVAAELTEKVMINAAAQTSPADSFVISGRAKVWHRIARGPPEWQIGDWSTLCGWNFARPAHGARATADTMMSTGPLPDDRKALCLSCFPSERRQLKAAAQKRLLEQVGELPA